MSKITLRSLSAATGPTDGSTGIFLVNNGGPLTIDQVDYNFLNLNYGKLDKNLNLSDVQSVSTARANLGLGTMAVYNAAGATGLGNVGATGLVTFTSGSTGALVVSGGVGVGGNLTARGTVNLSSLGTGLVRTTNGQLQTDTTSYVTSSQTVAITGVVSGSTGITGTMSTAFPNNAITGLGTLGSTGVVTFSEGSTGALIVRGGAGVSGNLTVAGVLRAETISAVGNVGATGIITFSNLVGNGFVKANTTGGLSVDTTVSNLGTLAGYNAAGATGIGTLGSTGVVTFAEGSTGALVVIGGVGITGNLTTQAFARFGGISQPTIVPDNISNSVGATAFRIRSAFASFPAARYYNIIVSALSANKNITIPAINVDDTFVFENLAQTLTNKTVSLAAGSTSTAPLTFTSGTNLTNAVAGSVEYDGTVFYATPSSTLGRLPITSTIYNVSNVTTTATLTSGQQYPIFDSSTTKVNLSVGYYKVKLLTITKFTGTSATNTYLQLNLKGGGTAVGSVVGLSWPAQEDQANNQTIDQSAVYTIGSTGINYSARISTESNNADITFYADVDLLLNITTAGTIEPSIVSNGTRTSGTYSFLGSNITIVPLGTSIRTGAWS